MTRYNLYFIDVSVVKLLRCQDSEPKKRFHQAVLAPEPNKRFENISNCPKRIFQNFPQIKCTHTKGGLKKQHQVFTW